MTLRGSDASSDGLRDVVSKLCPQSLTQICSVEPGPSLEGGSMAVPYLLSPHHIVCRLVCRGMLVQAAFVQWTVSGMPRSSFHATLALQSLRSSLLSQLDEDVATEESLNRGGARGSARGGGGVDMRSYADCEMVFSCVALRILDFTIENM